MQYLEQMVLGGDTKPSSSQRAYNVHKDCERGRHPANTAAKGMSILAFFITLSLPISGIAWGGAKVESRAQPSNQQQEVQEQASLDLLKKIEFLQQEMQELRGKVEEQTYQVQQLQEQQKKLYTDLDRRMREGGSVKASTTSGALNQAEERSQVAAQSGVQFAVEEPATAVTGTVASEASAGEEKAYQTAYYLIQNKDYDGALAAFQALAASYPHGKYLPNAYYWLGEIYLVKGNLDLAADAFNRVYQNFAQHPKAADSLLKMGYVEYNKGQWKRAEQFFVQVKNQFPGSTSSQLADSKLQKMQQEGHL